MQFLAMVFALFLLCTSFLEARPGNYERRSRDFQTTQQPSEFGPNAEQPQLNRQFQEKNFKGKTWDRSDTVSNLGDDRSNVDVQETRPKSIRSKQVVTPPVRRKEVSLTLDENTRFNNPDLVRETVLVSRYSEANLAPLADIQKEQFRAMVDELDLRDINRFQFSSSRGEELPISTAGNAGLRRSGLDNEPLKFLPVEPREAQGRPGG